MVAKEGLLEEMPAQNKLLKGLLRIQTEKNVK